MPIYDTVELSVRGLATTQQHIHTLHFRYTDILATEALLIAAWQGAPQTAYRALFATAASPIQLIHAQQVCGTVPLRAAVEVAPLVAATAGTRVNDPEVSPSFCASLVGVKTALAGRTRQGRFFLGGLYDADYTGNLMNAPYITLLTNYVNALMTAFVTPVLPQFQLVVHSRKLAAVPGTQCQDSSTPVTNLLVSNRPTTMRSRKFGHGQ